MSFTDEEKKRIEDEELKVQEEIRARFKAMLFKDDPEYLASDSKNADAAPSLPTPAPESGRRAGRVMKQNDVQPSKKTVVVGSKKTEAAGSKKTAASAKNSGGTEGKKAPVKKSGSKSAGKPASKSAPAKKTGVKPKAKPAAKTEAQTDVRQIAKPEPKTKVIPAAAEEEQVQKPLLTEEEQKEQLKKTLLGAEEEPKAKQRRPKKNEEPDTGWDPEPSRYAVRLPGSCYTGPGVRWFNQEVIPSAASERTRHAELNHRSKVRSSARRQEKLEGPDTWETVKRSQVSWFSKDYREEDSILPDRIVYEYQAKPTSLRKDQLKIRSIDNSKKTRRRRMKQNKPTGPGGKIATVIIILLVLGIAAIGYTQAKAIFDDSAMDPTNLAKIEYTVTDATSDEEVAEFLVKNGMVESELMYRLRAKIFDADYVAGTYELSPSFSTEKIINILSGFDYQADSK